MKQHKVEKAAITDNFSEFACILENDTERVEQRYV